MKKLSVLFITLVLALSLSACGNNKNDNSMDNGANQQNQNSKSLTSDLTTSNQNPQQSSAQTTAITREEALKIALEKAGAAEADIRDLDIELDNEHGVTIWEIDFDHGNSEYSYDVNAETGAVTKVEHDRDN